MGRLICRLILFSSVLFACLVPCLTAQESAARAAKDDILGLWNNQEKDAKIQIYDCEGKYCGKIVSLANPNYPPGSKDGTPGTPKLDHKNPDPALRQRPVLGLQIMKGFEFAGDKEWKGGKIYDPKSGKTYSGKITMVSPTRLNLRGYVGVSLFGRTDKWTKAE